MKRTRYLANRLTTSFTLAVVVPLVIASLIFGWGFVRFSAQSIQARQKNIVEVSRAYVDRYFNDLLEEIALIGSLSNRNSTDWVGTAELICQRSKEHYISLAVLDKNGSEISRMEDCHNVSADTLANRSSEEAFFRALRGELFVGNISFDADNQPVATISFLTKAQDRLDVVIIGRVDLGTIWEPLNALEIGDGGYIYVVDRRGNLVGYRDPELVKQAQSLASIPSVAPLLTGQSGVNAINYSGLLGEDVIGSSIVIEKLNWGLVLEQPTNQVFATRNQLGFLILAVLIGFSAAAVLIALYIARSIVTPIRQLAQGAEAIAREDFSVIVTVGTQDEIGLTANAFNQMTARLRELIQNMEQRVADRTKALVTSSEISRRLSTILDQKELVTEVVNQVKNAFGYYYTQIYFYDKANENLVMAGGTGEAGELILAQFHQVAKGRGLVGRAAESNKAVLVSDTSQTPEWLPNSLLPDTKSEVAIPISIGDQVLGVLDVQHNITDGLQQEDVDSLQSIANQVAVAFQNIQSTGTIIKRAAELQTVATISTTAATISDVQKMLESVVHLTQRGFGLYHAHVFTYNENAAELQIVACGYREGDEHEGTHGTKIISLEQEQSLVARAARTRQAVIVNDVRSDPGWLPNPLLPDTASEMAVPMIVGDQILGVLDVQSERLNAFTDEDANIQTTLASQVATALQNARSFSQSQRQAERETAVNLITQKIQSATTVETALQVAARELGHALGMKPTLVSLEPETRADGRKAGS